VTEEIARGLLIVELSKKSEFPGFATDGGRIKQSGIIYISHPVTLRKLFHAWRAARRIRREVNIAARGEP